MADRNVTEKQVMEALSTVKEPELGRDLVSLGFVKDVAVTDGVVSFTITLTTPACPMKDQMRRESEQAIRSRFRR